MAYLDAYRIGAIELKITEEMIFSKTINIFLYIHTYKNAFAGRILRHFNPVLGDSGRNPLEPGTGFLTFMELTKELVKSIFDYHEDGYLTSPKNGKRVGDLSKSINRYRVSIRGKRYLQSRIIFLWHNGYLPVVVDHENRIKTDDRIENLRAATKAENNKNCTSWGKSTSKYLGVSLFIRDMNWHAQISINYKQTHLGYFSTEIEAASAYNDAAKKHHGEFANLNILP